MFSCYFLAQNHETAISVYDMEPFKLSRIPSSFDGRINILLNFVQDNARLLIMYTAQQPKSEQFKEPEGSRRFKPTGLLAGLSR
jgi:hypothetical protein